MKEKVRVVDFPRGDGAGQERAQVDPQRLLVVQLADFIVLCHGMAFPAVFQDAELVVAEDAHEAIAGDDADFQPVCPAQKLAERSQDQRNACAVAAEDVSQ